MPTDKWANGDTGIINSQHTHASLVGNPITYASNAIDQFHAQSTRIRLGDLDLNGYSEAELRNFRDYLDVHLADKYPPKPPKFNTAEEADAWMEKHYGQ